MWDMDCSRYVIVNTLSGDDNDDDNNNNNNNNHDRSSTNAAERLSDGPENCTA